MDLEQKLDLAKINATVKVTEMTSMLRSAFQPLNFSKVVEIMVSREKTIREEVGHWKREYELMEKKHGETIADRFFLEHKLSDSERKLGELADQVAQLEEDRRLDHQKEILVAREKRMIEEIERLKTGNDLQEKKLGEEMKARLLLDEELSKCKRELCGLRDNVEWLEEEKKMILEKIKVSDEREKRARDTYKKLVEDFEMVKRENMDLLMRNTESELARVKAERELNSCRKKNVEVELRVTRLEDEVESLINQRLPKPKVEEGKYSTKVNSALEAPIGTKTGNPSGPLVNVVISDGKGGSSTVGADCVNSRVNWPKDADAGFDFQPYFEGKSTQKQIMVERGGSSQRESQREKCQKIGTVDMKTEFAVVEISDSDTEMPTQNVSDSVPNIDARNFTRSEEVTMKKISKQADGRNQSSAGSKRNGFWDSSSSDSDSDGDSCGTVAIDRIIACREPVKPSLAPR